jgi:hypothetical protein
MGIPSVAASVGQALERYVTTVGGGMKSLDTIAGNNLRQKLQTPSPGPDARCTLGSNRKPNRVSLASHCH